MRIVVDRHVRHETEATRSVPVFSARMSSPPPRSGLTRRVFIGGVIGGVLASGSAVAGDPRAEAKVRDGGPTAHPSRSAGRTLPRSAPTHQRRRFSAGTTIEGRTIDVVASVAARERISVLVVAAVHGNETVTRPIAESIAALTLPDDISLYVVPEMNPDGCAANTRRNARNVDLNRNFPWRWTAADGGPSELSEPETRAMTDLVAAVRPTVSVWIHQPLGYVGPIGACPAEWADAWRYATGDRRRDGVDQHGGGESWTANVAGASTLLVEARSWDFTPDLVAAHTAGFGNVLALI